jgi:DNA-binding MurR/RpiR family transcriptional regulator
LSGTVLDDAVELIGQAEALWVAGARRAYPVAAYLAYALQHADKAVQLVDFVGPMHAGQLRGIRRGDAMVVVSFAPADPMAPSEGLPPSVATGTVDPLPPHEPWE